MVSCETLWLGLGASPDLGRLGVLAAFVSLIVGGGLVFPPHRAPAAYMAWVVGSCVLLLAVCWWKGEPPRWRWVNIRPPKP